MDYVKLCNEFHHKYKKKLDDNYHKQEYYSRGIEYYEHQNKITIVYKNITRITLKKLDFLIVFVSKLFPNNSI